jgi:hypothetical protein
VIHQLPTLGRDALRRGQNILPAAGTVLAGFLVMQSTACSATALKTNSDIELLCSVKGVEILGTGHSDSSICSVFRDKIGKNLPHPLKIVQSFSQPASIDRIKVEIRFSKAGSASALAVRQTDGVDRAYPEIVVDVMDKSLGQNEVDMLAAEVAKMISQPTAR